MKINTDLFPVKQLKNEDKTSREHLKSEKSGNQTDRVTFSNDTRSQITKENQAASRIDLFDYKKAEQEVYNIKSQILNENNNVAVSEIHQLDGKRVLFLALD